MEKATKTPMISVLMPVYNVKPYLEMAIDSVLNQTFRDFELILINDGSTDGSGEILEDYRRKDARINVYHVENGGVARGRNLALSYATGSYITYVDSDDSVENTYLEHLYETLVEYQADIATCGYYRYVEAEKKYYFPILEGNDRNQLFTGQEVYENYYCPVNGYNILFVVAWGKLIKRELFEGIFFPPGKLHEDSYTIYKLYLKSDRIVHVNEPLYMYRIREHSIMSTDWSKERIRNFIEQHEERLALLTVLGITPTESNRLDYCDSIKKCAKIALKQGYVEEYLWLKQKIDLIEVCQRKQTDSLL